MQYSECWNLRFRTGKWSSPLKRFYLLCGWNNCCFSHDITKIQTTKLSILPRFYFHDVLEQLKTNFQTNFRSKKVLSFVIEYAWISKLLRDAAFTWRSRELSCTTTTTSLFLTLNIQISHHLQIARLIEAGGV